MLIYYEKRKDGSHELLDELEKLRKEKVKQSNANLDKAIRSGNAKQIKQIRITIRYEASAIIREGS